MSEVGDVGVIRTSLAADIEVADLTPDVLGERFVRVLPALLEAEGFEEISYESDATGRWGVLRVADSPWRRWVMGLQILDSQSARGPRFKVFIRVVGIEGATNPILDGLDVLMPRIRAALERAAHGPEV